MSDRAALLVAEDLGRRFPGGVDALQGVSFSAAAGEVVAVTGPSGCGKSTLLALLGLLDQPTRGRVLLDGQDLRMVTRPAAFRARHVGFVFQHHFMIPTMTLIENVAAPLVALGVPGSARRRQAGEILDRLGLGSRADFLPARVSGGERQRAAVARALVTRPPLVLADEPTGNLDSQNGDRVAGLLVEHAGMAGALVVVATHNPALAALAGRTVALLDGRPWPEMPGFHPRATPSRLRLA